MADYISREAAKDKHCQNCMERAICYRGDGDSCPERKSFDTIPAADVRPVVLCKDCRHRDPEDHKCDCGQLERAGCVFPVDENYWCAYGEKGENK